MPITFETGDLFATSGLGAYAHGCNCAGAMGKGIAVAFRARWPAMYAAYRGRCKAKAFQLGDVFVWEASDAVVFNLGTQPHWTTPAEAWAVRQAVADMIRLAEDRHIATIALPRIGAGLGGLEWGTVRAMLEEQARTTAIHLRVCETYVQGVPLAP
ncbi:macro domain-containing protein [Stenotrophomonas sp.]|uniref:macro domain-containing protein n=1 Tax=Stenotrophomonas sp. TaxID=69392 RepID=UPI002FC88C0E